MAKGRNSTIVAARISDELNEAALKKAEELGLTLSELVGLALDQYVRPEQAEPKRWGSGGNDGR